MATMLLACLGLYPQVSENLDVISHRLQMTKRLFVLVHGRQDSAYGVWFGEGSNYLI